MSNPSRKRIFIAGGGGIGRALGLMLRNEATLPVEVVIGDLSLAAAEEAVQFASHGGQDPAAKALQMAGAADDPALEDALAGCDALVDCLPGALAPRMAGLALKHGLHYLNLTEYVAETNQVLEMSKGASTCFALQCGLAPGFINVLAHDLFQTATRDWGVTSIDRMRMRVGALTRYATGPHYYGWTWSPVGVATEYVKEAIVVRGGETMMRPSLSDRELLQLDGRLFEEDLTSGGAADLPEALAGRVVDLDYKTLRYPGHYAWVDSLLEKIPDDEQRADELQRQMEAAIPHCQDDVVVIYADVEGNDSSGKRRGLREALFVPPIEIAGQPLRAIQSTTAAGVAESLRIALETGHTGPLLQSQIPSADYINGPFVQRAYYPRGAQRS